MKESGIDNGLIVGTYSAGKLKKGVVGAGETFREELRQAEIPKNKPCVHITLDEVKEQGDKIDVIDKSLHVIEIMNMAVTITFALFLFILFYGIEADYIAPVLAKTIPTFTGNNILAVYISLVALFCLILIRDAIRNYKAGQEQLNRRRSNSKEEK